MKKKLIYLLILALNLQAADRKKVISRQAVAEAMAKQIRQDSLPRIFEALKKGKSLDEAVSLYQDKFDTFPPDVVQSLFEQTKPELFKVIFNKPLYALEQADTSKFLFSPHGTYFGASSEDGTVNIWRGDVFSPVLTHKFENRINELFFDNAEQNLIVVLYNKIHLINIDSNKSSILHELPEAAEEGQEEAFYELSDFNIPKNLLAVKVHYTEDHHDLHFINIQTEKIIKTIAYKDENTDPEDVQFDEQEGDRFFTFSGDGRLIKWDIPTFEQTELLADKTLGTEENGTRYPDMIVSDDGKRLVIGDDQDNIIALDVDTNTIIKTFAPPAIKEEQTEIEEELIPESALLLSEEEEDQEDIFTPEEYSESEEEEENADITPEEEEEDEDIEHLIGILFSDGDVTKVGVNYTINNNITIFDLENNTTTILQGHEDEPEFAAFNNKNTYLVTAGRDKTLRIWDMRQLGQGTINPILTIDGHEPHIGLVEFRPPWPEGEYDLFTCLLVEGEQVTEEEIEEPTFEEEEEQEEECVECMTTIDTIRIWLLPNKKYLNIMQIVFLLAVEHARDEKAFETKEQRAQFINALAESDMLYSFEEPLQSHIKDLLVP